MKQFYLPLFFLVLASFSQLQAQYNVGHTTITFQDPSRGNRNIQTEIYYPSSGAAGNNVPIANDTFPVIVFGHGFVMAWSAYQNIWDALVPKGYIMAFPRTEGNAFNTNHQRFGWDLQYLVGAMQAQGANSSSVLYQGVATSTAIMGHSMGGGAGFLAADSLCQNGSPLLRALVGLAPAESTSNGVSSINSARSVTVPSLILSGSQDGVTPPNAHHIPMYDSLASTCKTFVSITGGAHCYFANSNFNCDFGEGTSSSGITVTRAEQQGMMLDYLEPFLDYWLKYDCGAAELLMDSLNLSPRTTFQQNCTPSLLIDTSVTVMGMVLTANANNALYQWMDCSAAVPVPIIGANNASYTAPSGGSYLVQVQQNHCLESSNCITLNFIHTNTLSSSHFAQLFPNPSAGQVQLQVTAGSPYQIVVYNLTGQVVYEAANLVASNFELDIENWPAGQYYVQIKRAEQVQVLPLTKQ